MTEGPLFTNCFDKECALTGQHTGRATREANAALGALPERMQREQQAQYNAVLAAVRSELRAVADTRASEEGAMLAQLSARIAVSGVATMRHVCPGRTTWSAQPGQRSRT